MSAYIRLVDDDLSPDAETPGAAPRAPSTDALLELEAELAELEAELAALDAEDRDGDGDRG